VASPRVPSTTYRVQLNQTFRFSDVSGILDYLQQLGISDVYLSPILASRKGSGHGYDVIDPTRINPELGTEEEFVALQTELQNRGMGLLLDTVPNHMAASAENPWWMDVLENGAQSAFAAFFDIEWHPPSRSLDGKILLPVLGRPFGEALDSGEIKLVLQEGRLFFQYFESLFPLTPRSYYTILNHSIERVKNTLGADTPAYDEYSGILASVRELADADRRSSQSAPDRRMRFEASRDRLRSLVTSSTEVKGLLDSSLAEINGTPGDPATFGILQRLLGEQNYKLVFWQNLNESINYRRFFTIADLVGVRVEDPLVFEATHSYILRLVAKNALSGLRIDHIDGLRDPLTYLNRLQERLASDESRGTAPSHVLVEKILARHEDLPEEWPVSGTTGYDYLNEANGLFVEPQGARCLEEIYSAFIGRQQTFDDVVYQKKKLVMNTLLGVEMNTLGRQLAELASQDRYARELNRAQLIDALIEVTACLGIYRTYIRNIDLPAHAVQYIEEAITNARNRAPQLSPPCFDFLREVMLILNLPHVLPDQREDRLAFIMRWQQFTGPIVAKGIEDTALYVYHPLLSLNEVGGDPRPTQAPSLQDFYTYLGHRRQRHHGSLNATSTHDTKRSEDVRARLNALSEVPSEWKEHLERWAKQNAQHKDQVKGQAVPDRNEEYFLYQTLLGVWPIDPNDSGNNDCGSAVCQGLIERVQAHLIKATREAMVHTRWTRPNQAHEDALVAFVGKILSPSGNPEFLEDFRKFQRRVAYLGMINSLSQTLLKIAAPGVPDFYQGSELWDLRLVDPDNRGPIDFVARATALENVANSAATSASSADLRIADLMDHWPDGRIKLYLIRKALRFRREHKDLFADGEFIPLRSEGRYSRNVLGFLRRQGTSWAMIAAPRWTSQLSTASSGAIKFDWDDTRLMLPKEAPGEWRSIFGPDQATLQSGAASPYLAVPHLFRNFPVGAFSGSGL
jgi:(1->4)-alpha-D-glucan 1-alpha-D-glucosylmutase